MSATVVKLGASALAVSLAYFTLPAPQATVAPPVSYNAIVLAPPVAAPAPTTIERQAAVVQLVAEASVAGGIL